MRIQQLYSGLDLMFLNLDLCGDLPDYFLRALFTFLLSRAASLP